MEEHGLKIQKPDVTWPDAAHLEKFSFSGDRKKPSNL
jgi:hypothetical protein